jgi:integrase
MARQRESNLHLPKYVTINHGSYWFKPPDFDKRVRICAVGDDQELYAYLAKYFEGKQVSGPVTTMNDVFDRYQREIVPQLAPRTQKDYHKHLNKLREVFGHMRPDDVLPKHVGQFLDVPKGKMHRKKMVAVLSAVFGFAVGAWYVAERNPCRDVKRIPNNRRTRYVTHAEFEAFRAIVPPRMQIAMDLAYLTAQRQGDLLDLKWSQVETIGRPREEWGILFTPGKTFKKTGKRLRMEVTPALEEVLVRARKLVPQLPRVYVLRTRDGKRYTSDGFRAIWQRYMRRAIKQGVLKERFTFHDLRAKNISDSTDLNQANLRANHTSMAMTKGVYDRGIRPVKPLK